jgi:hypothetical protein
MTDKPEPIRKSLLPCTPPPEWEFSTVIGTVAGCMLVPSDAGDVVVRRQVSYGDWEPVRPDRWAEEPPSDAALAEPAAAPSAPADADLRDQVLHALDFSYCNGIGYETPEQLLDAYDAHQAVLPAPADDRYVRVPRWEYELMEQQRQRAERAEAERDFLTEKAQQDECTCDPAPHSNGDGTYSHGAGCPIADAQQRTDEAQQAETEPPIVAYRDPKTGTLYCARCGFHDTHCPPMTADDLPDGGICTDCGVDVLISQAGEGR